LKFSVYILSWITEINELLQHILIFWVSVYMNIYKLSQDNFFFFSPVEVLNGRERFSRRLGRNVQSRVCFWRVCCVWVVDAGLLVRCGRHYQGPSRPAGAWRQPLIRVRWGWRGFRLTHTAGIRAQTDKSWDCGALLFQRILQKRRVIMTCMIADGVCVRVCERTNKQDYFLTYQTLWPAGLRHSSVLLFPLIVCVCVTEWVCVCVYCYYW